MESSKDREDRVKQEKERMFDEIQAACVLAGAVKIPHEELANYSVDKLLTMFSRNHIKMFIQMDYSYREAR